MLAAVRVLGMAGNEKATLLREAAAENWCGSREAKDALRRIEGGAHPPAKAPEPAPAAAPTPTASSQTVPVGPQ